MHPDTASVRVLIAFILIGSLIVGLSVLIENWLDRRDENADLKNFKRRVK